MNFMLKQKSSETMQMFCFEIGNITTSRNNMERSNSVTYCKNENMEYYGYNSGSIKQI